MKIKKTWFSYVLWGLFSIILFASVGVSAIGMSQKTNVMEYLPAIGMYYGIFILGTIIFVVFFVLYHKYIKEKLDFSNYEEIKSIEKLFLSLGCIAAVVMRVVAVVASYGNFKGDSSFYDMAILNDVGMNISELTNGDIVYVALLRFLFQFFGNKAIIAMSLQIVFQVITLIFVFHMAKNAIGKFAAWFSLLLYAFLPGSFLSITYISPDNMIVTVLMLYLFVLSCVVKTSKDHKFTTNGQFFLFVLLGFLAGLASYFDIIGVAFFPITIFALCSYKSEEQDMAVYKPGLQVLFFALSFLIFAPLLICGLSFFFRGGYLESLISYGQQFIPANGFNLTLLNPHYGSYDAVALYVLAGVWFVAFLKSKIDYAFPFVLMIICSTVFVFLGFKTGDYTSVSSILWILCATVGITSINVFEKEETLKKKTEKNEKTEKQTVAKSSNNNEDKKEMDTKSKIGIVKNENTNTQTKLIKNPLPQPKPHVPKEMNYDYIPKPNEMDYDLKDMRGKEYYDI